MRETGVLVAADVPSPAHSPSHPARPSQLTLAVGLREALQVAVRKVAAEDPPSFKLATRSKSSPVVAEVVVSIRSPRAVKGAAVVPLPGVMDAAPRQTALVDPMGSVALAEVASAATADLAMRVPEQMEPGAAEAAAVAAPEPVESVGPRETRAQTVVLVEAPEAPPVPAAKVVAVQAGAAVAALVLVGLAALAVHSACAAAFLPQRATADRVARMAATDLSR